ncbi:MAG: hypothetical protein WC568_12325, partial [Candidatus Methanoperedens sp.]
LNIAPASPDAASPSASINKAAMAIVLSKTVAPLYFADTYAHRHTWIPHKARCRFSNNSMEKKAAIWK